MTRNVLLVAVALVLTIPLVSRADAEGEANRKLVVEF